MITLQELKTRFEYNPLTGIFIRLKSSKGHRAGEVAGTRMKHGHISIGYGKRKYLAHRLAWYYVNGNWPKDQIDHINGNPTDNRICNLRETTQAQNRQNQHKSKAGERRYMGTTFCKRAQKWISQCTLNGVTKYVGSFDTAEEASKAYLKVKQDMHEYFNK